MSNDIDDFLPPWAKTQDPLDIWRKEPPPRKKPTPRVPPKPAPVPPPPPTVELKKDKKKNSKAPVENPLIIEKSPQQEIPMTPGKLVLQLKLSALPHYIELDHGWKKFIVDTGILQFEVVVRPKIWNKLAEADRDFPKWTAGISGDLGARKGDRFILENPGIQIYEVKPRPPKPEAEESQNPVP